MSLVTPWSDAASRLADRLTGLAVADLDGSPSWTGDDLDPSSTSGTPRVVHGPLDEGLLCGRSGIALALAGCSRLPDADPRWAELARRAAFAALDRTWADLGTGPLGWDSGALGVARAASVIADLLGDAPLSAAAQGLGAAALWQVASEPDRLPPYPDLLGGVAGVLVAAACAPAPARTEPLRRDALAACVERLESWAQRDADGVRWPMATVDYAVAGLAHGASGVAFALRAARRVAGGDADPWDALADDALRWEAGLIEPASGGWPDLRSPTRPPALAWCHGAPGIGVCAALTVPLAGGSSASGAASDGVGVTDPGTGRQASAAHATYLRAVEASRLHLVGAEPFDGTLCHGLAGVVELHLLGAQAWPEAASEHLRRARAVAKPLVVAGSAGPRWTCGLPVEGVTPNLLVGIAGVALTLVRCHDPALAPSPADPTLGWAAA